MNKIDISKLKIPEVDMSQYKDAVTIVTDLASQKIAAQLNEQIEDDVYAWCTQYGICVDKERLFEILKNDRISYQNGWRAGYAAALEAEQQRRKSYRPKLLPCKYCGGKRRYVAYEASVYFDTVKGIGLVCCKCYHRGPFGKSENEARRLWNEEMSKGVDE